MRIEVRLFANLAAYRTEGREGAALLELADGATVAELCQHLAIPPELPRLTLVNGRDAGPDVRLWPGDVVSLLPPLVGG